MAVILLSRSSSHMTFREKRLLKRGWAPQSVLISLTVCLHESGCINLFRQKEGKLGIITLFHAIFQGRHVNPHIRSRHVNVRGLGGRTHTAWLSGEERLFHKPGRARSDRLCTTFFHTPFFLLNSSPLLSFTLCCRSNHCVFTYILQSPQTSIHFFFFFSCLVVSLFCHLICFFFSSFLFSPPSFFMTPVLASLIIPARIFSYIKTAFILI